MSRLQNGQVLPEVRVELTGGGTLVLPDALRGSYGIILVYRGSWCPVCNAQLAAFAQHSSVLLDLDARVVALSADDEATTADLIAKHELRFAVGHSADVMAVAERWGAYFHDDDHRGQASRSGRYLQATGILLRPDGTVLTAVYSTRAIGRLVAEEVVGLISYERARPHVRSGGMVSE